MMQLETELSHEIDPERMRLRNADIDELARQPREICIRKIGVR